jgi:hypothetical protein
MSSQGVTPDKVISTVGAKTQIRPVKPENVAILDGNRWVAIKPPGDGPGFYLIFAICPLRMDGLLRIL